MARWGAPLAVLLATAVAVVMVHRFWIAELSHVTGEAQWMWVTDQLERVSPTHGLFVASFSLPIPPREALLKVCGDREYVVYANGTPAACGWSRPGFRLDLYDIGHLLRQGDNVLAVEVRSPTPVGGVLLALDVAGVGANVVASGRSFVMRPRFSLAAQEPHDLPVPVLWGRPPRQPWGYPRIVSHPRTLDETLVLDPIRLEQRDGVALAGGGIRFDLPHEVEGFLWLELEGDGEVYVATGREGDLDEEAARARAQVAVRSPGQRRWLDPWPRSLRSIWVFARELPTAAELWPLPTELRDSAPGIVVEDGVAIERRLWTRHFPPP